MKQIDWTKWSAIAEVVSSAAILLTLVYLALQTQQLAIQNEQLVLQTTQYTAAVQASTRATWLAEDRALLEVWFDHPEIRELMSREDGSLTDMEKIRLSARLVIFVRNREIQWLQRRNGVIDEATWQTYSSAIGPILSYEITRPWWDERSLTGEWDAEFVAYVSDILSTTDVERPSISDLTSFD